MAETGIGMECWGWQAGTIYRFMRNSCDEILQGAEHWRMGSCNPRQSSMACSTLRILPVFFIYTRIARFHPLYPKRVAAPWHSGAKKIRSATYFFPIYFFSFDCMPYDTNNAATLQNLIDVSHFRFLRAASSFV